MKTQGVQNFCVFFCFTENHGQLIKTIQNVLKIVSYRKNVNFMVCSKEFERFSKGFSKANKVPERHFSPGHFFARAFFASAFLVDFESAQNQNHENVTRGSLSVVVAAN